MKISDREIERQIKALEASHGASARLREVIDGLDITDHIADCFVPVHEDVSQGSHTFYNLPGGRGSGKSSFVGLEVVNQILKDLGGYELVCQEGLNEEDEKIDVFNDK